MPLFNWNAPTSAAVVNPRFWIYLVIAIPATLIISVIWRMWYKFEEWRQSNAQGKSFHKDAARWLKSGRRRAETVKRSDIELGAVSGANPVP